MEVFKGSSLAYASELDLDFIPDSDIGYLSSETHVVYPTFNFKDVGNPIQFDIAPSNATYLDFRNSKVYSKMKVAKADGSKLESTDLVAPCKNFFRALFSSCEISANGTPISNSGSLFPYKGHIVDTISHTPAYKSTILAPHVFIEDDKINDFTTANSGFVKRADICKQSASFEVVGRLAEAIFEQPRLLPPECGVRITLKRSDAAFALESTTTVPANGQFPYIIEFEEIYLLVQKKSVNKTVVNIHNKQLHGNKKFYYPLSNIDIRAFNITSGTQVFTSESIYRDSLPSSLIVTFIDSPSFIGRLNKDPFNFSHFDIEKIRVTIDGDVSMTKELSLDIGNNVFLLAYSELDKALNELESGKSVSMKQFKEGDFFLFFDLFPSSVSSVSLGAERKGSLSVDFKFKQPLTSTITCLVLGKFQSIMTIDKNRVVSIE